MIVTGDKHGKWNDRIGHYLGKDDKVIVAGDLGFGFFGKDEESEERALDELARLPYTILFCDGNHENFDKLNNYPVSEWNGGRVHLIRENIIHLMRGEIYDIDGNRIFVMGGGTSRDKIYRPLRISRWPEELPNDWEYQNAMQNLKRVGYEVNYIVTHTAPTDTIEFMKQHGWNINLPAHEEWVLNSFLNWIQENVRYKEWYLGHFHIDKVLWKNQYVLFHAIRNLETGELVKQ